MATHSSTTVHISGQEDGRRVESRILEERIQRAVTQGARDLAIEAHGQHGLGGRLWISEKEPITVSITGSAGQRVGAMGFPNTRIEVLGPASDDVGWLNAGAEIVVHGNASNGCANAMAQGKVMIGGNIGARGMTMTKANPRFTPPELWVLGSAGDSFAEFMAGGTAVICGHTPQDPENVLGFRPCVGMVGGRILVRGPHKGFSLKDARLEPISDADWDWLTTNLRGFLKAIRRPELLDVLTVRETWQQIVAKSPYEKSAVTRRSMSEFRTQVWDRELGRGGLIGDLTPLDRSPIPLIVSGELRRFVPVWENKVRKAPCQSSCPTGIPVQQRWQLIRDGHVDEAVDLALAYTPFPATVCGYLCPHLCMQGCTRSTKSMIPVDITFLGKAGVNSKIPALPELSGKKVAVIGGGAAGISAAWQIRLQGHEAVIHDMDATLGGKLTSAIPSTRIPKDVLDAELTRVRQVLPHVHLKHKLTRDEFQGIVDTHDFTVLAVGAQKPRVLSVPGADKAIAALTFLKLAKKGQAKPGKRLVIVGAGNVGCDVATEAARFGAEDITLIDIQKPAAFGKEKIDAEAVGAKFRWPCFTREITDQGLVLTTGELIPADTVVFSIGDQPDLDFLPATIAQNRGYVVVNDQGQTSESKVFAIGDIVKPGLLTDAIGAGRKAALTIGDMLAGRRPTPDTRETIAYSRIKLEYFDPRLPSFSDMGQCASECSSCGSCRDCGMCEIICPRGAISRKALDGKNFEMVCDAEKCIGCGFCAGVCPCGVWSMFPNTPMG